MMPRCCWVVILCAVARAGTAAAAGATATRPSIVEYPCGGVTRYPVPFRFLEPDHLVVAHITAEAPHEEQVLRMGADYTVSGARGRAGSITLASSAAPCPTPGARLRIRRETRKAEEATSSDADAPRAPRFEDETERLQLQVEEVRDLLAATVEAAGGHLVTAARASKPRSLSERFADTVNVRDFGAVGDGKANDTRAVEAAYEVMKKAGGTIFFPPGTYRINLAVLHKNIRILGAGFGDDNAPGATVLRPWALEAPVIQIGDGVAQVSSVEIAHLSLLGDGASPRSDGLVVIGAAHIAIHHVWVSSFGGDNISLTSSRTRPTHFVFMSDFISKWARGAGFKAIYGPKWTTAIDMANFTISGHDSRRAWTMHLDGTSVDAVNGYMDLHGDHGVYLKKSGNYPNPSLRGAQVTLDVAGNAAEAAVTFDPEIRQGYVASYVTGTSYSNRSVARWLSNGAIVPMGTGPGAEHRLVSPHVLWKLVMARQGVPGSTDLENGWGRLTVEDYSGRTPYWSFNTDANDYRVALRSAGSSQYPLQFQTGNGALYVDAKTLQLKFSRGEWWPRSDSTGFAVAMFVSVPSSARATCQPGDWSADERFLYLCLARDQWRRIASSDW